MRIVRVEVTDLFGMFTHEFKLNQESRISIIHGPNGIGKTVIMKMLDGLFRSNYKVISDIPFGSLTIEFGSGENVIVKRIRAELPDNGVMLEDESYETSGPEYAIEISYKGGKPVNPVPFIPKISRQGRSRVRELIESRPEWDSFGNDRWVNTLSNELATIDEIVEAEGLRGKLYGEPKWLSGIQEDFQTRFIQAQRLHDPELPAKFEFPTALSRRWRRASSAPRTAVARYSQEIAKEIRDALAAYGQESQIRDRSFPTRLMEYDTAEMLERDRLQSKLDDLEEKSSNLIKLGLFEDKDVPDIPKLDNTKDDLTNVLSIYVQDIEEKLAKVDEISRQLEILKDIINSRFMCKTLEFDKRTGFVFRDNDSRQIPTANLSSGEQHELVLIYQLLFHVKHDSLIMIDEPEISLHVDWQEQFLNDLQRIISFRKFDLLLATHSPTLVDDKWEWVVGLKYPEGVC